MMSDRTMEQRYQDAEYKAMVWAYQYSHRNDAEKEPEPETDLQKFARAAGAPAPGFMLGRDERRYSRDEQIVRKLAGLED